MAYFDKYGVEFSDDRKTLVRCPKDFTGDYVIPDSVTSIGDRAFRDCIGLTFVTIPDSVTCIGDEAFSYCSGLTSIIIPNGVTAINKKIFQNCKSLVSINLPASIEIIYMCAFDGCDSLNEINFPNTTNFCYCKRCSLASCINNKIVGIDSKILGSCLLSVEPNFKGEYIVPNNVEFISIRAFYDCNNITSIILPSNLINIGENVFKRCSGLVAPIYNAHMFAFMPTTYSGAYTIPDGIESIAERAFKDCTGLTSIEIPNSVTSIGESAFSGCSGLTSIDIPNSVVSIGYGAFSGCSGLTSVRIPDSVTSVGDGVFAKCTNLSKIIVSTENPNYCFEDGVLFNKDKSMLVQCTIGKQGKYTIPNSVTRIGNHAFAGCCGLTSITIPDSITSIGDYAFASCKNLTSVTIPNSVTSVGDGVFFGCEGLTSVNIPNSVTDIRHVAFYYCGNLKEICVPKGQKSRFAQMEGLKRWIDIIVERDNEELSILLHIAKGYELGIGMPKSLPQALVIYMQVAEKGCAEAAYHLGEWYEQGEYVPQDLLKALEYFKQAAKSGFKDAQSRADKMQNTIEEKMVEETQRQEKERRIEEERRQAIKRRRQEERQRAEEQRRQEEEKMRKLEEEKRKEEQKRREQQRIEEEQQRNPENIYIGNILNLHSVKCFYHFTSRKNLASIRNNGGLYSWQYLKKHNIDIPVQGGGELSQGLDRYNGVADYVHLSFCNDHPMAYRHIQNGEDIVVLEISTDVAMLDGTMFSDMNAVDSRANCAPGLKGLKLVDFVATSKRYVKSDDPLFKYKQAEILVKTHVPLKYILNIDEF